MTHEKMSFKGFLFLVLASSLFSRVVSLEKGHSRNIFMKLFANWSIGLGVDIILSCFFFSFFSSCSHLVYRSEKISAILVGSHLGNIPVIFESHCPKNLREDSI